MDLKGSLNYWISHKAKKPLFTSFVASLPWVRFKKLNSRDLPCSVFSTAQHQLGEMKPLNISYISVSDAMMHFRCEDFAFLF